MAAVGTQSLPLPAAAAPKERPAAFTFPGYNRIIYEICLSFGGVLRPGRTIPPRKRIHKELLR